VALPSTLRSSKVTSTHFLMILNLRKLRFHSLQYPGLLKQKLTEYYSLLIRGAPILLKQTWYLAL
jgi:hypothetical protein